MTASPRRLDLTPILAVPTVLIAVLPTHAEAGVLAPVLVIALRLAPGLSIGGERGPLDLLCGRRRPAWPPCLLRQPYHPRLTASRDSRSASA